MIQKPSTWLKKSTRYNIKGFLFSLANIDKLLSVLFWSNIKYISICLHVA